MRLEGRVSLDDGQVGVDENGPDDKELYGAGMDRGTVEKVGAPGTAGI